MKYWKAYTPALGFVLLVGAATTLPSQLFFKANGTGAVLRSMASKEGDTTSAKDFGAVGDGSTDDTTAVQACLNAGGGTTPIICELPPTLGGYKLSSLITLAKLSTLRVRGNMTVTTAGIRVPDAVADNTGQSAIDCPDGARIKLANSANVDLIANTNFATMSGTGLANVGTFKFNLSGCILDGNKANQTALVSTTTGTVTNVARSAGGVVTLTVSGATTPALATGMTINVDGLTNDNYSFNGRFIVQSTPSGTTFTYNQTLRNTVGSGAATGATPTVKGYSGSGGVRIYGRAGRFQYLTVANNVLDGMWHEGYTPTAFTDDSTELETLFLSVRTINSGGNGLTFWGPQMSRHIDGVSFNHGQWGREIFQALVDTHMVSYLNTSGSLHVGSGGAVQQAGSQESSAGGWGILVDSGSGPSEFTSMVAACNGCIGIEFRSPSHQYAGVVQNSSTGVKFNGGGALMTLSMTGNTTWFDCTSENGNVFIDLYTNDNNGTMKGTSCWTGSENLRVPALAGHTVPRIQIPGSLGGMTIGGWTPTFPANNGTIAETNFAQTFSAVQTFSSAIVQARSVLTYSATIATDASTASSFSITVTDGNAFTISNPTNLATGEIIRYTIKNTSGGAHGLITWGTTFKTQPTALTIGTGFNRTIEFIYDGTNLIETRRTGGDVTN